MRRFFIVFLTLWLGACVTTPETGRRAFIVTTETQENTLGEQAFRQIVAENRLSTNARWNRILQRVGNRISQAARRPDFRWEIRLFDSNQANAFCLPGGRIGFFTGIFPPAETEAGLAAIMGHEVAHATARHAGQRLTLAFGTTLAFEGLNAILGGGKSAEKQLLFAALGLGAQVGVALPFSRGHELEADEIGLVYMARAGYDPQEAVRFWQRFGAGGSTVKFLSTHPPSAERSAALAAQLPGVLAEYRRSSQYGVGEKL